MHRAPIPTPDHDPVREDEEHHHMPGIPPPEDDPVPDHNPS
ncbi:MAG: hypothetical protein JWQ23_2933 [Herminiimonas sp.]|jgi:hypothetical protein|nr:hypothetical protein [Herminiimonas sp.]